MHILHIAKTTRERSDREMGIVTDVFWRCPRCFTINQAQVYGEWEDPESFPRDAVPHDRRLKWNPPCSKCGGYQLVEPNMTIEFPIVRTNKED